MSTAPTVPIFDPQGVLRDVPYEHMRDAVSNGGKPAVRFAAPDQSIRYVPADKTQDAAKAGGTMQPIEQQAEGIPELYGFTPGNVARNAWQGFKGTIASVGSLAKDLATNPNWVSGEGSTLQKFVADPMHQHAAKAVDAFDKGNYTEAFGHAVASGLPIIGPAAAAVGEQAGTGDVGGAAGQVAGTVGAGAVIGGAGKLAAAAPGVVSDIAANPSVQAGVSAAAKKLPVAAIRRIPYVGDVAADVYKAGAEAAANAKPIPDATAENVSYAGEEPPAGQATAPQPAAASQPVNTSSTAVEKQLNDALGGKKLVPGVPLKNQPAAMAAKLPEGFTPVEKSSVLKGYKYDPAAQEFTAITNNGQSYTHGEVTPDQVAAFEGADSKGSAWTKAIRDNSPLVRKNGAPVKPIASATGEPAAAEPPPKAAAAAAGAGGEDLTPLLQQSLDRLKVPEGGVHTMRDPAELVKRWGVDQNSIAATDENLRGMNQQQSQQYIDKLADSYRTGRRPVEPVLETRDASNNIVDVDGRHRALAAQKAGIKQIPIIVRRLGVTAQNVSELAARPK